MQLERNWCYLREYLILKTVIEHVFMNNLKINHCSNLKTDDHLANNHRPLPIFVWTGLVPSGPPSRSHITVSSSLTIVRGDDPNAPPLIFDVVLEVGAYPLARHFLSGQMIGEIVWSQAPNEMLMATPPPIDPSEQLLPRSYRSAFSQLRSGFCSRLQSYRHSVGWPWPHLPRLSLLRPQGDPSLQLPFTSHELAPRRYVGGTPSWSLIPGRAPTVQRSAPTADRIWFLSLLTLIPSSWASGGSTSSSSHTFTPISFHPWSSGRLPPPLTNNNNRALPAACVRWPPIGMWISTVWVSNKEELISPNKVCAK